MFKNVRHISEPVAVAHAYESCFHSQQHSDLLLDTSSWPCLTMWTSVTVRSPPPPLLLSLIHPLSWSQGGFSNLQPPGAKGIASHMAAVLRGPSHSSSLPEAIPVPVADPDKHSEALSGGHKAAVLSLLHCTLPFCVFVNVVRPPPARGAFSSHGHTSGDTPCTYCASFSSAQFLQPSCFTSVLSH